MQREKISGSSGTGRFLCVSSLGEGWKLRQKFETSFANRILHGLIADIGKIKKWSRSAEFLALKKQWCPGSEQKQCGHGAIAAGRSLKAHALAESGVRNLIVILDESDEGLWRNAEVGLPRGASCHE